MSCFFKKYFTLFFFLFFFHGTEVGFNRFFIKIVECSPSLDWVRLVCQSGGLDGVGVGGLYENVL